MTNRVVYFLGAGASLAAGATAIIQGGSPLSIPTQATFWPTFLRFSKSASNRRAIESFLFRYFLGYRKVPTRLGAADKRERFAMIDVEEVFTFLSERVRAPSTSPQLRTYALRIWGALVAEFGHVFCRFRANKRTRAAYKAWLHNHFRQGDVVVSFNYDTIFEDSLPHNRKAWYEAVGPDGGEIPLLKPHGSVNWETVDGRVIVRRHAKLPIIVAPTHLKFVAQGNDDEERPRGYLDHSEEIASIWASMETHMKAAHALVFVGYSFPVADLYFSSVLRSVLADRDTSPGVIVVNPDAVAIADRLQRRFPLPKVVKYFDLGQFVSSNRAQVFRQLL